MTNLVGHYRGDQCDFEDAKAKPNCFVIDKRDEEKLIVKLNGKEVARADHDSDGWAGMENVENVIKNIAKVLSIPVTFK